MEQLPDLSARSTRTIVVETTIDRNLQTAAERSVRRRSTREGKQAQCQPGAPLVTMDAPAPSRPWSAARLCREPVQPRRQGQAPARLGLQALRLPGRHRAGRHARHVRRSTSRSQIGGWTPENYHGKYFGPVTLTTRPGAVAQHRRRQAGQEVGPAERSPTRPRAWASTRRCRPTPRSRSAPRKSPCSS